MSGFVPQSDAGLKQWADAVVAQVTSKPADFGLTTDIVQSFTTATQSYSTALAASTDESTRTHGSVAAKDSARTVLRRAAMSLAALVQAHPDITPKQLTDLGLTVRRHGGAPVPPPATGPVVSVLSVTGRVVRCKLTNPSVPTTDHRPLNAIGAVILAAVGPTPPPANDPGWTLQGQTGRMTFSVNFPENVAPGTPCWITAMWVSRRGQYSLAADPVRTYLQVGPVAQAA